MRTSLSIVLAAALLTTFGCRDFQESEAKVQARNIILLIGDGVDDHQLTLGRNYLHGAAGTLNFDNLEHRATARVLTVLENDPNVPNYVGDSASGGTALSAGVVTSSGRIATTAQSDRDVPTILELAKAAGRRVGVVATSSITDATPASFYAHVSVRFCEGPDDMLPVDSSGTPVLDLACPEDDARSGGPGSIAEQLVASGIDVALGGGLETFEQADHEGIVVLERAEAAGFEIVRTGEELAATDAERVLGLFVAGHLPVIWQGKDGGRARPRKGSQSDDPDWPPRFGCEPNPAFAETPTLAQLTQDAIGRLSKGDQGFFLMVESASIDKQSHAANPCGQIGETLQLEEAVQVALDFAAEHPDTLVLVASDHGHAAQVIPYPSLFESFARGLGTESNTPGKLAVVETPEGGTMGVNYATTTFSYEEHTGTAIPIFGQGPGAEKLRGLIDQTEIFEIMKAALGI